MNSKVSWVVPATAFVLFGASITFRYLALNQTPYANGWDSYFYINQIKSFMEEGKMDVPDVSLVYPLMMVIQLFTDNYELSYKILAGILAGTFTMSMFLLALKWSNDCKTALIPGCLSLFSPHLTYFAAQYPKNLLGVIFFIWLLYSADSKNRIYPILLLILNFFGHRVTAVLGFLYLLTNTFLKKATKLSPYVLILVIVLLVGAGFFLPGILNLFDVERFQGVLSARPQFAPYSFVRTFGFELISPLWLAEIIVCCIVFIAAAVFRPTALILILSLLIFPFLEWTIQGPAFRFFLIFILLCPILLTFLFRSFGRKYVRESICVVFVVGSFFSYTSYDPARHDPPYKLYSIIGREILAKVPADSFELIIAHKSLAEYIVYSTDIDAMSWIPEYKVEENSLWRIAEGVRDIQFSFYLDPEDRAFVHRLTPSYSLVREDRWEKFMMRVKEDGNEELLEELTNWKNPDKVRPYFMLRNKGS